MFDAISLVLRAIVMVTLFPFLVHPMPDTRAGQTTHQNTYFKADVTAWRR
jgi:hypothetical protein